MDAVVTDPPYGVDLGNGKDMRGGSHGLARRSYANYEDTYENLVGLIIPRLRAALALAKRGACFPGPHLQDFPKASYVGGIYCPAASGRCAWGFITFLPILFYGKDPRLQFGAKPNVLESNATTEKFGHPCPKPVEWMRWLIERTTLPGETVLDPFMGSGTTGVACVNTGRNFIGIEIDKGYFDIAQRRIAEAKNTLFEPATEHEQNLMFA